MVINVSNLNIKSKIESKYQRAENIITEKFLFNSQKVKEIPETKNSLCLCLHNGLHFC